MNDADFEKISSFLKGCSMKVAWVDFITNHGPTKIESMFKERYGVDAINHWSPSVPEGYLEVFTEPVLVVHWVIGEENRLVDMSCIDSVDFDEIDRSMASSIIHNSVIRILSEKF